MNPTREAKKQQARITAGEGPTRWGIIEDSNTVKLWFAATGIDKDAVKVVLNHDDVLEISQKKAALDVRLLMTASYEKELPDCRWEKKDDGEVRLEVTIKKRPTVKPAISVA